MVLEKTSEGHFGWKEIKPVNPKRNQPWIFTAESEAPILWPPDVNSQLIGKDPDSGKDWGQEEKRVTEDNMVVWHHWCNGHELGQTPGDGEGHGSLVCCSPWGREELDTNWWLNKLYAVNYMQWKLVRCCGQEQGWWRKPLQVALLFWASSACKNSLYWMLWLKIWTNKYRLMISTKYFNTVKI